MKLLYAAVASLGVIFAWLLCVETDVFALGSHVEEQMFMFAVVVPLLVIFAGLMNEIWQCMTDRLDPLPQDKQLSR